MSYPEEVYGSMVFSDNVMREKLTKKAYESLKRTAEFALPLDPEIADEVAHAMREWAVLKGATHFTHWFMPLTGVTAEKHEAFVTPTSDGKAIMEFSGKELIKGESDASSFPSGGLRESFEARGYTAWDCTSPAFVKDCSLYIPTVFCSYSGEALDQKTPLLRSMECLNRQTLRLLNHLSDHTTKRVSSMVGAEQEYFLVDRELYQERLDLSMCGRTLVGAKPPKSQKIGAHYYGRIRLRVMAFMKELDEELWKLGVPAKTKHNEAAPAQHELANVYSTANITCDHNNLTMEMMRKVAKKHGLACLLHEKPFRNVNGSGKHNNWSLVTDEGKNLLNPGKTPQENLSFILILCAILKGIDEHQDLLKYSVSSLGNDERLGGFEAPPSIISVYLGEELTEILSAIEENRPPNLKNGETIKLGVTSIPTLPKDTSDRNRTSPFAFTGNKFEFRMCGSAQSVAMPNYVLNSIVAYEFSRIADRLDVAKNSGREIKNEINAIILEIIRKHKKIIFNGNNYAKEWQAEAKTRGLNISNCAIDNFEAIVAEKNIKLFERLRVLSRLECSARHEITYQIFKNTLQLELETLEIMIKRQIIPCVLKYINEMASGVLALQTLGLSTRVQKKVIDVLNGRIGELYDLVDQFDSIEELSTEELKEFYKQNWFPKVEKARALCDELEDLIPKNLWPFPTYTDLMFKL